MNTPADRPSEHEHARFRVFDYVARIRRAILEGNLVEVDGYRQYLTPAIEKAWGADATLEIREGLLKLPTEDLTLERLKKLDDALDALG